MFRRATNLMLIGILLACPALARGETAPQAFARGKALLVKADFEGALAAFAAAARGDQGNQQYLDRYSTVRRILMMRQRLQAEQDAERWAYLARALHALYCGEGLLSEALAVGEAMHARLSDGTSAALLAETQLAMNRSAEAAKVLSGLRPQQATPSTQALLGIALARQGKADEARQVVGSVAPGADAGPQVHYAVARAHAATGNAPAALAALARCFESLPPSRQESFQAHARACPDFAALAASDGFAKALATASKVPESACSGGSGCAGCPTRAQCAKSHAQQPQGK